MNQLPVAEGHVAPRTRTRRAQKRVVGLGSIVTIEFTSKGRNKPTGTRTVFMCSNIAEHTRGEHTATCTSVTSPIGHALMNKEDGSSISYRTPQYGEVTARIIAIKTKAEHLAETETQAAA